MDGQTLGELEPKPPAGTLELENEIVIRLSRIRKNRYNTGDWWATWWVCFEMALQVEFERLELKYLLDEATAEKVRRAIQPFCVPDEHNGRMGRGYWISSLYFDSPRLAFFHANERADPDRFKLRARVYEPGGDVHLEIKRKRGDVVRKDRVIVENADWVDATRGFGRPRYEGASQERVLASFAQLLAQYGAEPRMVIEYEREAYASPRGEYARVSFDRRVSYFLTREHSFESNRG